jgi:DNA (cytosine-5)-methyltransferase 1
MRHGSLFSGIGGFDLAAEWMGWENVFHCEWMEFPRKVLDYHFPNADSHIDICKTDFKKYANKIDILTGGFPCQPFSLAGKRKGTDDERYLWGEMLRAIQEIKPKYVIAENVFGITNIDGGLVFEQVCLDLENEGYEVQPFIIPAAAKNAPHRRDRCWFVAFNTKSSRSTKVGGICEGSDNESIGICAKNGVTTNPNGNDGRSTDRESGCEKSKANGEGQQSVHSRTWTTSNERDATNSNGNGFNECNGINEINTSKRGEYAFNDIEQIPTDSECVGRTEIRYDNGQFETPQQSERREQQFSGADSTQSGWRNFPSQPPVCSGDDGIPRELDGITFPKWRNESIKAYGNAIVPQVAYQIFKAIQLTDENTRRKN